MFQHGMAAADAASTYTLLSIGDGLVAQLPALLVSSAVAMLVTRASRAQDMGQAVVGQAFGQYRALGVASAILVTVGLVPGMPNVAFLTLGAVLGLGLALPLMMAMLATNLTFGVLAKAAPSLHPVQLGLPVAVLTGMLLLSLLAGEIARPVQALFDTAFDAGMAVPAP